METKFTEQESLAVINEMITRARNNVQKGAGNSMVLWGIAIAIFAVLNFIGIKVLDNPHHSFYIWLLTIPLFFVNKYFLFKKIVLVKTHIDEIISKIWLSHFGAIIVFVVLVNGMEAIHGRQFAALGWIISPVIMILCGMAEFITAKACRFKPFFYGGLVFWTGTLACMFVNRLSEQFLILGACTILGFTIPGYLLNKKAKENV